MNWSEFVLVWSKTEEKLESKLYRRTRGIVLPFLKEEHITDFMITHYCDSNRPTGETKVRIKTNATTREKLAKKFEGSREEGLILAVSSGEYDPLADAQNRVDGAAKKVDARNIGEWQVKDRIIELPAAFESWEDIPNEIKVKQLEGLFSGVVGRCTEAFVSVLGKQPNSPWVVSVFMHLVLNSLGYSGPNSGIEPMIRFTSPL
jgi:hypothetical protein